MTLRPRTFASLIDVTRASTATFIGSNGLIQSAANNVARLDHDPLTLQPRGLLTEEQRTNLLIRSAEFDDAAWAKNNATVTANAGTAPDGTTTADKLISSNATTRSHARQLTVSVGQVLSVFAKAAEWSRLCLGITNNGGLWGLVNFNLSTGTIGANVTYGGSQVGSPTITALGNGWYRCSVVVTTLGGGEQAFVMPFNQDGDPVNPVPSLTGNGTNGILVWGAQLESPGPVTSYVPTAGSQVTRAADAVAITGTNFAGWYNQSEGTFIAEVRPLGASGGGIFAANDAGGTSNRIDASASGSARVTTGGVAQAALSFTALAALQSSKIALAYRANDIALSVNGGAVVTDTSATIPAVDRLRIGSVDAGSVQINGHIRSLRYYPARLTNAQLQELTA